MDAAPTFAADGAATTAAIWIQLANQQGDNILVFLIPDEAVVEDQQGLMIFLAIVSFSMW